MKYELKEGEIVRGRSMSVAGDPSNVNNGLPLGNKFQVRVLPEMNDIDDDTMLPIYPNFFSEDQIAYQKNDKVWVFCTEDFQAGFILGRTSGASGQDINTFVLAINRAEKNAGFPLSGFNDLTISNPSGASIKFTNERTGQSGVIYNTKVIFLYGAKGEIWVSNPNAKIFISPRGEVSLEGRSLTTKVSADQTQMVGGESKETSTSKRIESAGIMTLSAGGSRQDVVGSNKMETVLGDTKEVTGGSKTDFAGTGYSLTVGVGGLILNVLAGPVSIFGATGVNISSTSAVNLSAPFVKVSGTLIGPNGLATPPTPGQGGFCALPFCLWSGAPHTSNTIVGV